MDARYYKMKFHDAFKASCDTPTNENERKYSVAMLQALYDMAKNDVYPDGTFSDEECNVWSLFHTAFAVGSANGNTRS